MKSGPDVKSKAAVTLLSLRFIRVGDMSRHLFDWFHRCFRFIFLARYIFAALVLAAAQMYFYWVKRKSRLKPAKFFIRRGKAERFWGRLHPVFAYLPLAAAKTHRITRHEFSERTWIRDHSSRRLESVMQSATRSLTAARMMP